MIQFFFLRLLLAGILSVIVFFHVSRKDKEERLLFQEGTVKYRPFAYTLWLPVYMAVYYVFDTLQAGMNTANRNFFSVCFMVFLHVTVYYALLLMLLPFLRKTFDPHTCALLWILPSLLYITVMPSAESFTTLSRPFLIIPVPLQLVKVLYILWAIGFFAVLLWKVAVHFRFRKWISENSVEITDPEILRVWKEEQQATGIYPLLENPLLCCPLIKTPLSVGMWKDSTLPTLRTDHGSRSIIITRPARAII